jgi:hypothetical protein
MVLSNTKSLRSGRLAENAPTGGRDRLQPRVTKPRPQEDLSIRPRHEKIANHLVAGDGHINEVREDYEETWDKSDRDQLNLIHHIILELKRKRRHDEKYDLTSETLDVIEELVYKMPRLFVTPDLNDPPKVPILEAAKTQYSILFSVIDLLIPLEDLECIKRASCGSLGAECPLKHVSRVCLDICALKPASSTRDEAKDTRDGDSHPFLSDMCLHRLIDVEKLEKKNNELRETLRDALAKKLEYGQASCLHSLMTEANFGRAREESGSLIPEDGFATLLELCPDQIFNSATGKQGTPLQMAVRLFESEDIHYPLLFSVIKALVKRSPSSVFFGSNELDKGHPMTAYRQLKDMEHSKDTDREESRRSAEELLKEVCIASDRTRSEKKSFLYWNPQYGMFVHCYPNVL